jgi:predicted transcriptional regulator
MDRKQKEALVLALAEKGKTYREITKEVGVSPNTIKAVLNKAGLDQTASISSRAFELYIQQKTPIEVAIALNLEAKEAIRFHQEYIMLLGLTEFTKVYIQIKDNPWPYVNFVKLVQNSGMGDGEVAELLKIANGYLPRVRLEYDRHKAELNSLKAEITNSVRIYQDFCDRNVALKNIPLSESSQVPVVPDTQGGLCSAEGNRKILDTRELSHLDPAIENKAFQVYPEPKEKSSGSSIWPKDE